MTLPPFLRAIQQSYTFHVLVAAAIMAGGTSFTCFGTASIFSLACMKSGLIAGGIYLFASLQHSPGSASFRPDGAVNTQVAQVVANQSRVDKLLAGK